MITLLTDFGAADYFVPAVKGVILTINPHAQIVDITHEISAQDIAAAAFTLGACYYYFPAGSIHFAVVDPGVGSERRAIVVEAGGYFFVGPDNGIFSYVYAREPGSRVFQITRDEYFRRPVCATFHGRDVFAPAAARLSLGFVPQVFGEEIHDFVKFEISKPKINEELGTIEGSVIHIDRFGNLITNFTLDDFSKKPVRMRVNGRLVDQFGSHYEEAIDKGGLFAYPGSAGYWEIAVWRGSAAAMIEAQAGAKIIVDL
jgi:hypothetical protein